MNEILFLGTGAADWDIAQRDGFFRRNSAALLNRELMLDCGAHIFDFEEENGGRVYGSVTDILVTHSHSDHICADSVLKLAQTGKIRVGCDGFVRRMIGEHENIQYCTLSPFQPVQMGKYRVIPLLANHDVVADGDHFAFHYIIETPDGKTLFYGLDGAWFLRPSWEEMKNHKFDIMVFDCTVGDREDWRIFEHNTIPMLRMMLREIRDQGMLGEQGIPVASHLARTLHLSHEETAAVLDTLGMRTAFDGMKLTF